MNNLFSENLLLKESYGWKKTIRNDLILWFKGYITGSNSNKIHFELCKFIESKKFNLENLSEWCNGLNGHFAIVASYKNAIFAAVDRQ